MLPVCEVHCKACKIDAMGARHQGSLREYAAMAEGKLRCYGCEASE